MMRVRWTIPALRDLEEIGDYVAAESPTAAFRLVNALYERTERIRADNPSASRMGRVKDTRELVFADLPYIVAYRIRDDVEVLAVMHTARDWPEDFG